MKERGMRVCVCVFETTKKLNTQITSQKWQISSQTVRQLQTMATTGGSLRQQDCWHKWQKPNSNSTTATSSSSSSYPVHAFCLVWSRKSVAPSLVAINECHVKHESTCGWLALSNTRVAVQQDAFEWVILSIHLFILSNLHGKNEKNKFTHNFFCFAIQEARSNQKHISVVPLIRNFTLSRFIRVSVCVCMCVYKWNDPHNRLVFAAIPSSTHSIAFALVLQESVLSLIFHHKP